MSDRQTFDALKAMQWERAKGELRTMIALQGSIPFDYETPQEDKTWVKLLRAVNAFIIKIEDAGLHE